MQPLSLKTPSVGSVVKKITDINPDLSTEQVISLVRQSTKTRKGGDAFSNFDVIDEVVAVGLARQTLLYSKDQTVS